jgi:hypothetical protein
MKTQKGRCKCLNCKEDFLPDYRNRHRQRFCSKADCRKLSKRESQKAWLQKPANQNYFRDTDNATRVRQWQKDHPGYWKNTARWRRRTLQDDCSEQAVVEQAVKAPVPDRTLQDLCSVQAPLFVGLISMLVGSTLQDDIALTTRQLVAKGHDILGMVPGMNFERSAHEKTCPQSAATPQSPTPVQLDRSPAGAGKLLPPV